jgi:DNA polymerase-3 subunit delta'
MGRRKIFIVGDAERMVSQEGADQAANAFLKLLEEPLADTTLILTSSEPGGLLPTIRSRVVAFRCAPLAEIDVRAFLSDPLVQKALREINVPTQTDAQVQLASGAPGVLLAGEALGNAMSVARQIVEAAERDGAMAYATALAQGVSSARGAFSETLDALQIVLRERTRDAITRGDLHTAAGASRAIDAVLRAQGYAGGNVNPQLVTARLLQDLAAVL